MNFTPMVSEKLIYLQFLTSQICIGWTHLKTAPTLYWNEWPPPHLCDACDSTDMSDTPPFSTLIFIAKILLFVFCDNTHKKEKNKESNQMK